MYPMSSERFRTMATEGEERGTREPTTLVGNSNTTDPITRVRREVPPMAKTNLILITSSMKGENDKGEKLTTDGKPHVAQRIYPFPIITDGMSFEDAAKAIVQWGKDLDSATKSGKVEGALVLDAGSGQTQDVSIAMKVGPFGENVPLSGTEVLRDLQRGFLLRHQPGLLSGLKDKWAVKGPAAPTANRPGRAFDPTAHA
jgi:hypothetical protein